MEAKASIPPQVRQLFDIISFHDKTKELTEEGKEKRDVDYVIPDYINYIEWKDELPTIYYEALDKNFLGDLFQGKNYKGIKSKDVTETFFRLFPIFQINSKKGSKVATEPPVDKINLDNVLIAGGSIATIIQLLSKGIDVDIEHIDDIDLFIFGINQEEATAKAKHIIEIFGKTYKEGIIDKSEHAITLISKEIKIQIILRLYSTASEVLHGFDLGSSMVGIVDGKFITTSFGQYCTERRINVVIPRYSSSTYDWRLAKYLKRGYSIVMPYLNISQIANNENELPFLILIAWQIENNIIHGDIRPLNDTISDYSYPKERFRNKERLIRQYISNISFEEKKEKKEGEEGEGGEGEVGMISKKELPAHEEEIPIRAINYSIRKYMRQREKKDKKIYVSILYLHNNAIETFNKIPGLIDQDISDWFRNEKDKNIFKSLYNESVKITWTTKNPGRQFTSSFDPEDVDEEDWYVKFFDQEKFNEIQDIIGGGEGILQRVREASQRNIFINYSKK